MIVCFFWLMHFSLSRLQLLRVGRLVSGSGGSPPNQALNQTPGSCAAWFPPRYRAAAQVSFSR